MSRIDLLRYFLPIAPKLALVEAELQRTLQSDLPVVRRLAGHVGSGKGKRAAIKLARSKAADQDIVKASDPTHKKP